MDFPPFSPPRTPSFPGARPRSRRSRCGGRKSKFLAVSNVSFTYIQVQEYTGTGVGSGCYSYLNGRPHPPGTFHGVSQGTDADNPSLANICDTIYSGPPSPPFTAGEFFWSITWRYYVPHGETEAIGVIGVVDHIQTSDAAGNVSISKGGFGVTVPASAPHSGGPCPSA